MVSVRRDPPGTNTVASLVLLRQRPAWIGWKPRSRDVRREQAIFYTDLVQLYAPAAGVIEGVHLVWVRPAQGEISEVLLTVPGGATITDVIDGQSAVVTDAKNLQSRATAVSIVSLWRFDPDAANSASPSRRRNRGHLPCWCGRRSPPGRCRSSIARAGDCRSGGGPDRPARASPPARRCSWTPVTAPAFSADQPRGLSGAVRCRAPGQVPGLPLRRAFRYSDTRAHRRAEGVPGRAGRARRNASRRCRSGKTAPCWRPTLNVEITRAGIFRLSFLLPPAWTWNPSAARP